MDDPVGGHTNLYAEPICNNCSHSQGQRCNNLNCQAQAHRMVHLEIRMALRGMHRELDSNWAIATWRDVARQIGIACAAVLAAVALSGHPSHRVYAQDKIPVALELVLAIDTSASVDGTEFRLQIQGISAAFRHPDVIAAVHAIGGGGIAVSLVQWSQRYNTKISVPFMHVYDERTARAFSFLVSVAPRRSRSSFTAIGAAIETGVRFLDENGFQGARQVIDVSGDGRSNAMPNPWVARDAAVRRGITVNGLAIETDDDLLAEYYRDNVIGGKDAFVETAEDYSRFAPIMLRKLLREILPPLSDNAPGTSRATKLSHGGLLKPAGSATTIP